MNELKEHVIKSRWSDVALWRGQAKSLLDAVQIAVAARANLVGANLGDANLRGADLVGADLGGANLGGADLRGADLRGADLVGADLVGANLGDANLRGADLVGADLGGANLGGADLVGADLGGANLGGADLVGANLEDANLVGANLGGANLGDVRSDFFEVLSHAPREVDALERALREGRIDGTAYTGACACLVGTIANARSVHYEALEGLEPNADRPAERWFLGIRRGARIDHPVVAITLQWIAEWRAEQSKASAPEVQP